MGKISEALKKIMQEREVQKRKEQVSGENSDNLIKDDSSHLSEPFLEKTEVSDIFFLKPDTSSGIDQRVVTYYDYDSCISEQYRILRTNIKTLFSKRKSIKKSIAHRTSNHTFIITSAINNEGKTITAVNLAVAMASEIDKRILLVDCDLRKGIIHKLLNIEINPGLSEVIMRKVSLEEAILSHPKIPNLYVIPRGKNLPNPSELLSSLRMKRIVENMKAKPFDFIIFDTPPTLSFSDASIVGGYTEGALFVVRAGKSRIKTVTRAKKILEDSHTEILGFVLVGLDSYEEYIYGYYPYNYYKKKEVLEENNE